MHTKIGITSVQCDNLGKRKRKEEEEGEEGEVKEKMVEGERIEQSTEKQ